MTEGNAMKRLQRFLAMLLCLCVTAGMLTLIDGTA